MIDYGTLEELKPAHLCRADLCGGVRSAGSELCEMHAFYRAERVARAAKLEADAQALADVRTLDEWVMLDPENRSVTYGSRNHGQVGCCVHNGAGPALVGIGPTPEAARAKAAAWVREHRP